MLTKAFLHLYTAPDFGDMETEVTPSSPRRSIITRIPTT